MDYDQAANYWEKKDADSSKMDRKDLLDEMEEFIQRHNTCALATGCNSFVRCTPIEYIYKDKLFWILSEGGLKFYALKNNKNVCVAIFDPYEGFGKLAGMQVTGTAEMVDPESPVYLSLLKEKHISEEKLKLLQHELNLICITPQRIDFLWSGFQKMGYAARQFVTF